MFSIAIPELDWEIGMGCISGKFTTIEGILGDLKRDLIEKNPFSMGDSAIHEGRFVNNFLDIMTIKNCIQTR